MSRVPRIRFKGFEEDWEQRKLGEIADKVVEKNFQLQERDVFTNSAEFGIIDQKDFFDHEIVNKNNIGGYYIVSPNDFVYNPRISVTAPVGPINRNKLCKRGIMSPLYTVFHPRNMNETFLEFYFRTNKWHKFMEYNGDSGARSDRFSIKTELFYAMTIPFPSHKEQSKVGICFESLDQLITLHQRKVEKLKIIKKSMLENLFPQNGEKTPKIRFSGFTEDWEQRKLLSITTMHARIGWQNLRTTEFLDDGKYLLITGTDFVDGKIDFTKCYYVKQERYNQDRNIQIKNGCILITKDGTLGKVAYVKGLNKPATLNAGIFNIEIRDENKVDRLYLYQYIKAPFLLEYVDQMATGGTIKHLNQNILVDFMVSIPQSMEQKKIGELFQILDHLITLHQSKLEKLQKIKKSMLESMFV